MQQAGRHAQRDMQRDICIQSDKVYVCFQVIASVLMLTREISDNKTLTVKSSYHADYQASSE